MKNKGTSALESGLTLSLQKGPFQNNGASPWYASVGMGAPIQKLKFSFDTGSNFVWVTSTLCHSDTCKHYGGSQFNYQKSETFQWVDTTEKPVDFGPWGTMNVETGSDAFSLPSWNPANIQSNSLMSNVYLAEEYEGLQFEALNWDGGIGLPCTTQASSVHKSHRGVKHDSNDTAESFHFFQTLLNQGVVSPDMPYVTFLTGAESGEMEMGRLNSDYAQSLEYLYLPFEAYDLVPYVWCSDLTSFSIGDTVLASKDNPQKTRYSFCLDSGSSQFKGDPSVMEQAFLLASLNKADVTIEVGSTDQGPGKLVVPASVYDVFIAEGQYKGSYVPQFAILDDLDGLILAGSVLMDSLYTVYQFAVTGESGDYSIAPVGMWIFNKIQDDGTTTGIITTKQSAPATLF